jgi:cell wall-associated NlpC family hydrolase
MSRLSPHRPAALRPRAFVLALAALPGCASVPIQLDVSPARGPSVRATIGALTVAGTSGGGARVLTSGAASASAVRVLETADRYVGTRYRYGGESPGEGFDCSGFVQYVFGRHGVELPRTSGQQAGAGRAVPEALSALRPGDLMFFDTDGGGVDHVAIYAGDGRLIHAASGAGSVRYDHADTDRGEWLLQRLVASRRVLGGAS